MRRTRTRTRWAQRLARRARLAIRVHAEAVCRCPPRASRVRTSSATSRAPTTASRVTRGLSAQEEGRSQRNVGQGALHRQTEQGDAPRATEASTRSRADRRRARCVEVAATVHLGRRPSCHAWPDHTRARPVSRMPTTALRARSALRVPLARRPILFACLVSLARTSGGQHAHCVHVESTPLTRGVQPAANVTPATFAWRAHLLHSLVQRGRTLIRRLLRLLASSAHSTTA